MNIIGKIIDQPATLDDDGNVISEATFFSGFHVNTDHEITEWEAYRVYPKNPQRVYWGAETYHYRFESEAAFDRAHVAVFGEPDPSD